MTIQDIAYKTFEIPTNVEHQATPINLSGATTIKLTQVPASVKCWISTESTGYNLFPLINRGDGWVNLPKPLYDVYVYTKGTTEDNQKVIISYTGQSDFLEYGSSAAEKIEQVGEVQNIRNLQSVDNVDNVASVDTVDNVKQVQSVKNVEVTSLLNAISDAVVKSINKAMYNTYTNKVVARFLIQGDWELKNTTWAGVRLAHLPMGLDKKIADLGLDDNKHYRITTQGHFDLGNGLLNSPSGSETEGIMGTSPLFSSTAHFSIFNNTNGATYTKLTSATSGNGLYFDFAPLYQLNKAPWMTSKDEFNLWGVKHKEDSAFASRAWNSTYSGFATYAVLGNTTIPNGIINSNSFDIMIIGKILNSYESFGVFWTVTNTLARGEGDMYAMAFGATPNCHASLIVEVSEVIS